MIRKPFEIVSIQRQPWGKLVFESTDKINCSDSKNKMDRTEILGRRRLRNNHDDVVFEEDRVSVPELTRILNLATCFFKPAKSHLLKSVVVARPHSLQELKVAGGSFRRRNWRRLRNSKTHVQSFAMIYKQYKDITREILTINFLQ